jgi:predicted Zn finger-like uncharacterized protein
MIITCPHCRTRYQLAAGALGSRGRRVQCAHCHRDWRAEPDSAASPRSIDEDRLFADGEEEVLDADFEALARDVAEPAGLPESGVEVMVPPEPEPDTPTRTGLAVSGAQRRDNQRRREFLSANLPSARLRRMARVAGLSILVVLVVGMTVLRVDLVRTFPGLAHVYEALGVEVNVIGLSFTDVTTLRSRVDGLDVLAVDARIRSVGSQTVTVPQVIVSLIGADGTAKFEWSVTPAARELAPGEVLPFHTQLTAPPAEVERVRLIFAGDGRAPAPRS